MPPISFTLPLPFWERVEPALSPPQVDECGEGFMSVNISVMQIDLNSNACYHNHKVAAKEIWCERQE